MSFVRISPGKGKSTCSATEDFSFSADRQEQEISLRVEQELNRLRPIIMAEAQSAADESAHAMLKPLEQQLKTALSALEEANAEFTNPFAKKEKDIASLIVDIAFQLSHHIVGVHVAQDKMPLLNLITKLLNEINTDGIVQKNIIIHLSSSDFSFIKSHLPQAHVSFIEDSNIEAGGTLLECSSDTEDFLDKTVWDAQLKSRFDILRQALLPIRQARIK